MQHAISSYYPHNLAGRGTRWFYTALIDNLLLPGIAMAPGYLVKAWTSTPYSEGSGFGSLFMGIGLLLLLIVQATLLVRDGQSIGKKWLGIRIVNYADGSHPDWLHLLLLRSGLDLLLQFIPGLGSLYLVVDRLFILREDQRCIHDLLAGTVVVNA